MEKTPSKKVPYESETSIFGHPNQMPKANQLSMPTWALIGILLVAFVVLKGFIYLKDEKRHGK